MGWCRPPPRGGAHRVAAIPANGGSGDPPEWGWWIPANGGIVPGLMQAGEGISHTRELMDDGEGISRGNSSVGVARAPMQFGCQTRKLLKTNERRFSCENSLVARKFKSFRFSNLKRKRGVENGRKMRYLKILANKFSKLYCACFQQLAGPFAFCSLALFFGLGQTEFVSRNARRPAGPDSR